MADNAALARELLRLADILQKTNRLVNPGGTSEDALRDAAAALAGNRLVEHIHWIEVQGSLPHSAVPSRIEPGSADSVRVLLCVNGKFAGAGTFCYSVLDSQGEGYGEWRLDSCTLTTSDKVTAFAYMPVGPANEALIPAEPQASMDADERMHAQRFLEYIERGARCGGPSLFQRVKAALWQLKASMNAIIKLQEVPGVLTRWRALRRHHLP